MSFNPCNHCGVLVEDDDAFEAAGGYCEACDAAPRVEPASHRFAMAHIPTGHGEHVLCLQIHTTTVWAGLYPAREAEAPTQIGVAPRRSAARAVDGNLFIAGELFPLRKAELRRAVLFLDRHGVRTRDGREAGARVL